MALGDGLEVVIQDVEGCGGVSLSYKIVVSPDAEVHVEHGGCAVGGYSKGSHVAGTAVQLGRCGDVVEARANVELVALLCQHGLLNVEVGDEGGDFSVNAFDLFKKQEAAGS